MKGRIMSSCLVKNSSPTKIYFWRGVVDPSNLLKNESVNQAVKEILTRNTGSGNLEKLKGHNIYSYRTSGKGRLLFKSITLNAEKVFIILDYLPNHEYHKSKFLKPSVTKEFCYQVQHDLEKNNVQDDSFISCGFEEEGELPQVKEFDEKKLEFNYETADFYGSKFIKLNPTQEEALHAKTPLIISGLPGSGKSCLAICAISNYVNSVPEDDGRRRRVLYVCSQPSLAKTMLNHWKKLPISRKENCTVDFLSYTDFISDFLGVSLPKKGNITNKNIEIWFKRECQKLSQQNKVNDKPLKIQKEDMKAIFEEFQIISTLTDRQQYFDLGKRECRFSERNMKEVVWSLFKSYKIELETKELFDKRFFKIPPSNFSDFDFIFNDEAADLAPLPYKQLIQMACNDNILFTIDTNQDTSGDFSKRVMIEGVFARLKKNLNSVSFSESYRCPERIVEIANRCLDMKAFFKGGTSDKKEDRSIKYAGDDDKSGRVERVNRPIAEIYQNILEEGYKETDVAIICEEEHGNEVKMGLIFTPEEIKGLEYKVIILHSPLDSVLFKQLNVLLSTWTGESSQKNLHRPKVSGNDQLESTLTPKINALFTSITRAQEVLIFNQDSNHQTQNILKILEIDQEPLTPHVTPGNQQQKASIEDWYCEAKRLWENGNFIQFENICQHHLNQPPETVLECLGLSPMKKAPPPPQQSSRKKIEKTKDSVNSSSFPLKNRKEQKKSVLASEESKKLPKKTVTYTSPKKEKNTTSGTSFIVTKENKNLTKQNKKLMDGCYDNLIKIVKNALRDGADVKTTDSKGSTPLMAASQSGNKKIVEMLLEKGADVNVAKKSGVTALMVACLFGHKEIVEMLLKNGADVNAVNSKEGTALGLASEKGHKEIVELLLENGAEVDIVNSKENTPLMSASNNDHKEIVEMLLKKGADVNGANKLGLTALRDASLNGHKEIVEILLKKGADVNATSNEGSTPLMAASLNGHKEIVELLLEKGADVNVANISKGYTALMFASMKGHKEIVEMFLERGVNVNAISSNKETALQLSLIYMEMETANIILKHIKSS
jgi:ankyrin repeat protein